MKLTTTEINKINSSKEKYEVFSIPLLQRLLRCSYAKAKKLNEKFTAAIEDK